MKDLNKEGGIFWRSSSICKRKDLILPHEHLKKYRKGKGGLGRKVTSFKASCVTVRTLCPGGLGNSVPQSVFCNSGVQRDCRFRDKFFSGKTCSDSSELILKFIPSLINIPEIFSGYVYVFDY